MGNYVYRKKLTTTLSLELYESLHRLCRSSGTPIGRLLDGLLNVEVLDSISDSLDLARSGKSIDEVSSYMTSVVGQHVIAASEVLKDFQKLGDKK